MFRKLIIFAVMFFSVMQTIPGSSQFLADHVVAPMAEHIIEQAEQDFDVKCCDENGLQDANICKPDCKAVLAYNEFIPRRLKENFTVVESNEEVFALALSDLRPPIS